MTRSIETPLEAQILKNLGITLSQGYLHGRPGPAQQLAAMA